MKRKRTKDAKPHCVNMLLCLRPETRNAIKEYQDLKGLTQKRPTKDDAVDMIIKEWRAERKIVLNGTITKIVNEQKTNSNV